MNKEVPAVWGYTGHRALHGAGGYAMKKVLTEADYVTRILEAAEALGFTSIDVFSPDGENGEVRVITIAKDIEAFEAFKKSLVEDKFCGQD